MTKTKIKVLKRDGSIENFNPEKIKKVVQAAGVDLKQAERLIGNINNWTKKFREKPISSAKIREKVLVELKKVNQYAAGFFEWYEKMKLEKTPKSVNQP